MKTKKEQLKEFIEQEESEPILAEVLEYVKVLRAFMIRARKPPTPKVWARLPRWRQLQILLISELYYRIHLLAKWLSDQRSKYCLFQQRKPNG